MKLMLVAAGNAEDTDDISDRIVRFLCTTEMEMMIMKSLTYRAAVDGRITVTW